MTTPLNNTDRIPIDAALGNENHTSGSASMYLFWMVPMHKGSTKPEIGMDSACRIETTLRKESAKVWNAMLDRDAQSGGTWTDTRYTVAEGTCLKLWGEKSVWGQAAGKAAIILLCSKNAPVNQVKMKLSGVPSAARNEVGITGQFWVLNRDTVKDHLGIPPLTPQAAHYSSPVFIQEVFTINEAIPAPEKPMAQKVVTQTVDTGGAHIKAAGTSAGPTIVVKTLKGRRVLG